MSVIVVGLSNRSAPLELLERTSVSGEDLAKALSSLRKRDNISEVVVLSTCMRTEVYALAERFHGGLTDIIEFLSGLAGRDIEDSIYNYFDLTCVSHLFRVASGLESAVLGEGEVLGQLRDAWIYAMEEGASGPTLNTLFRHAVEVGKRTRTEVKIKSEIKSLSQAAVALVENHFGVVPKSRNVLIIGKGVISSSIKEIVMERWDNADITVADRSSSLGEELKDADIVFCATTTPETIIHPEFISNKQQVLVDLSVPRNIDPNVEAILFDIDSVARSIENTDTVSDIEAISNIIEEEVSRYQDSSSARLVAPLVAELRNRFEKIRKDEISKRTGNLSDERQREIDRITKSIVAKVLHEPTVRLKEAAGTPKGERLCESLRDLFDISDQ